jgi:hypothetical protein
VACGSELWESVYGAAADAVLEGEVCSDTINADRDVARTEYHWQDLEN